MTRGPERILDEYLVASAKAGDRDAREFVQEAWISAIRKAARQLRLDTSLVENAVLTAVEADPSSLAADRLDIGDALAALPAEHRIVVDLFYSDDLSISQISEAIGIPAGTVKSRLHHARQVLKRHFSNEPLPTSILKETTNEQT